MGTMADPVQDNFPNFSSKLFDSQQLGIFMCPMSALNLRATELEKTNHIYFLALALQVSPVPFSLRKMSLGSGDAPGGMSTLN